jgi:putative membrane protein
MLIRILLVRILLRLLVLAVAIGLAAWILPGVDITGGFFSYLWIAILFAIVNAVLGPILALISLPITVLTLGLFALVVNAALVGITAWLSSDFSIDGFWNAVAAAVLISIFAALLGLLVREPQARDHA